MQLVLQARTIVVIVVVACVAKDIERCIVKVHLLEFVGGDVDDLTIIVDRIIHALHDFANRIRDEAVLVGGVVALSGCHQPTVASCYQLLEGNLIVAKLLSAINHEEEVGLDELVASLRIALTNALT